MPKQYKIDAVAEIESKIESNAGVYVVSYNGLTVLQAQELRKQLREAGAQMKVYKNNLVRIALENKEQPNLDEMLVGPLAYVFFEEEPVSAAKVLKEDEIDILVDLGSGSATAKAWGCDLTYDYVKINGDYRT